ncbi:hypothetical protein HDU81_009539, partial [Chytriomyces hyalinus]
MTDCGANQIPPPLPKLGCHATHLRHVDCDERPELLIINVVVKVMARLYYGRSANQVCVDTSLDHPSRVSSSTDSASTYNTTGTHTHTSPPMNPRMYQELFDLRSLVVTLHQKSPARNARALTVVMMQALLL